jgi:hypothetical protein
MSRAAILFSDFGPYHVARIEALGRSLAGKGIKLDVAQSMAFEREPVDMAPIRSLLAQIARPDTSTRGEEFSLPQKLTPVQY